MLSENIKAGDRVEISIKREGKTGRVLVSQVETVENERRLIAHVPISYGQLVPLTSDEVYSFLIFTDLGMIRFDAKMLDSFKQEGFHFMKVLLTSEGERMQRRDFYRFPCLLPIKYSVIADLLPDEEEDNNPPVFEGIIKDLGGGGVRFIANEPVEEGRKLRCILLLENDYVVAIGRILHRQYFPKSVYRYQYRIIFMGLMQEDQNKIVHYIFQEQRKNLQRGIK